jgi:integrase
MSWRPNRPSQVPKIEKNFDITDRDQKCSRIELSVGALQKKSDEKPMAARKLKKKDAVDEAQWSRWYLVPDTEMEKALWVFRRYARIDGATLWDRLPRDQYKGLAKLDLDVLLKRLNAERDKEEERAKTAYELKHEFITEALMREWEEEVRHGQTSDSAANAILNSVRNKFLRFFIEGLKLTDPMEFYDNQRKWGKALLNEKPEGIDKEYWTKHRPVPEDKRWSKKTIKDQVMFANRFIAFLHSKKPRLFPLLIFRPLSHAVLNKYEAKRRAGKNIKKKWYVKDEDWELITKGNPQKGIKSVRAEVLPYVKLAYFLGLRDAETLGVQLDDIGVNFFDLQRQLASIPDGKPEFDPPKNRKARSIPYWRTSPKEIYEIVKNLPPLMHPDTLIHKVSDEMRRLGLPYTMHDFRRSWITRSLIEDGGAPLALVKDAAGHASIATTNLYLVRPESFENKRFKPSRK